MMTGSIVTFFRKIYLCTIGRRKEADGLNTKVKKEGYGYIGGYTPL